jgi:hypothetical protein
MRSNKTGSSFSNTGAVIQYSHTWRPNPTIEGIDLL